MQPREWWQPAMHATLWAIGMTLVMGWLARSRLKPRPSAEARHLVHPISTLVIGVVCVAFFGGIAVLSNVYANKTTTWWTTTAFVGFALMGVPVIADYVLARHVATESGLSFSRWTGRRDSLRWEELRSVRYAQTMKWFRLETHDGKVARISVMLLGLPEFARLVLEHAPGHAIDPAIRPILEATAEGRPPSVWQ